MYKHIVVAVDGSRTSLNALQHASSLAVAGNARLTLITVANPSEYMTLAPEFLQHDSYEAAAVAGGNEVLAEGARSGEKRGRGGCASAFAGVFKRREGNGARLGGLCRQPRRGFDCDWHARPHGFDAFADGQLCRTVMRQSHLPLLVIRSVYSEDADESENDREEFSSSAM